MLTQCLFKVDTKLQSSEKNIPAVYAKFTATNINADWPVRPVKFYYVTPAFQSHPPLPRLNPDSFYLSGTNLHK